MVNIYTDEEGPCHQYRCHYGATCIVERDHASCQCYFLCLDDVIQQVLLHTTMKS